MSSKSQRTNQFKQYREEKQPLHSNPQMKQKGPRASASLSFSYFFRIEWDMFAPCWSGLFRPSDNAKNKSKEEPK